MSAITITLYRCDWCGKETKRLSDSWCEVIPPYPGSEVHVCGSKHCREGIRLLCAVNKWPVPNKLAAVEEIGK